MKIGVFTALYNDKPLEETLIKLTELGVEAVEIGTGAYPGSAHCPVEELLASDEKLQSYKAIFDHYGLFISALSCHGNPVHPDKARAEADHRVFEKTVLLAEKLGVKHINVLSGCPGGSKEDKTPNWALCPWPEDFLEILDYQWNDVLIPYWKKAVDFAKAHGVVKIGVEMHPGFCVYNPETLLKLRAAVGPELGCNFDPSHLFWQGIDVLKAIDQLGDAIFHVHAKANYVDPQNVAANGVLDTKHYSLVKDRAWTFRTVGYGTSSQIWRNMISKLALLNYHYVLSIEHEDVLMTREEGLKKAVDFLQENIIRNKAGEMWWA